MGDSANFRGFVMDDCTRLMSRLFTLIDEVAFAPLRQRLAQRLLADADPRGVATVTHQKLADEVGSVREVVSRILAQDLHRFGPDPERTAVPDDVDLQPMQHRERGPHRAPGCQGRSRGGIPEVARHG
jgi:hypothetical protein